MLNVLKYKEKLLESFYLDEDDKTIRRKTDGYYGRYKKNDIVTPFRLKSATGDEYERLHIPGTRNSVQVHWLLTLLRGIDINEGDVIDHINGKTSDNSRENIRITSQRNNSRNRKKRSDNSTGYTGVSYMAKNGIYTIRKTINGVRLYKSAKSLEEAVSIAREFEDLSYTDGYTERHGK